MQTKREILQMRTYTFWCKKLGFFEIYGVSARTRGEGKVEQVWTFFGQGG